MFVYFFTEYVFSTQDGQNRNLKNMKNNKKPGNIVKYNHTTKVMKKEKKNYKKRKEQDI